MSITIEQIIKNTHSTFASDQVDPGKQLLCAAMGLCGESGEFIDVVKKNYEQGRELNTEKLVKELADVYYYVVLGCFALGLTKEDLTKVLDAKLSARYPNGFVSKDHNGE